MNYNEISLLSEFCLEDSYVLSIDEGVGSLIFELEAVLTENHPKYEKPVEGEQFCYRMVSLCFLHVESIKWVNRSSLVFSDLSGEFDYGNIDSFYCVGTCCTLSGDWGKVVVRGGFVKVVIAD